MFCGGGLPGVQYQVENRMVPIGFEQCRLTADLHGVALRKCWRQPYSGFDFQNSYCRLGVVSHQREIQMGLDRNLSVSDLNFQLRQGEETISHESLTDPLLEPVPPLEELLVFESFGCIFMFSCVELGSQCRPWAVQHLGDIR